MERQKEIHEVFKRNGIVTDFCANRQSAGHHKGTRKEMRRRHGH